MKKNIIDYLTQALLIVFSVVLALYLNEYISEMHTQKELKTTLKNIKLEISKNKEIVQSMIPYHKKVMAKINKSYDDKQLLDSITTEYGISLQTFAPRGVFQELVSKTAWETAKHNDVLPMIDYKTIEILTKTYNQQELTFLPAMKIIDILTTREAIKKENGRETMILIGMHFNEFKGRENLLLVYYNEALKALEEY